MLALVEGRLDAEQVVAAEAHLRQCASCADLVTAAAMLVPSGTVPAAPMPARLDSLRPGATFGRYTILSLLGRGGMGEVHAAYDPQLDRRVALKVLVGPRLDANAEVTTDTEGRIRLLREAKAIAKLSHPNVVTVHDAGEVDGRVFIAMEYVDGETLEAWLRAQPAGGRAWSDVVATFVAAGRGLAAAHEAGIVHRDFKPQNVMVGKDGRVRVMDFGLATAPLGEGAAGDGSNGGGAIAMRHGSLTRTGALMGTPLYMAPEQLKGEGADERSDQFSFCVALYQGLYGERPFPSDSFAALTEAVLKGRVRERAPRTNVPSWLRSVVLRGLAVRREDRHASMSDLLARLERNPARRRRWLVAGAALAVAAVVAGAGVSWRRARVAELCRRPAGRISEVWELPGAASAPRHDAVRRAFQAVQRAYSASALAAATRAMDAYAQRWAGAYADACDATYVRQEQPPATVRLRTGCLDEALGAFKTLTDLMVKADAMLVTDAVVAVAALPDLGRCDDARRLTSSVRLPAEPQAREQVERLRAKLAALRMLGKARPVGEGVDEGRRAVEEARAIGFAPAVAEALLALATLQVESASAAATAPAEEAFWMAMSLGEDELAEGAAHMLQQAHGLFLAHFAEGELWGKMTATLLRRLGPGHELEWSWYFQDEGGIQFRKGRIAASRALVEKGLELKRKLLGAEHPDVAISMCSLAATSLEIPDHAAALHWADQGLAVMRKGLGEGHPEVAICQQNRGEALSGLGRFREALQAHEEAGTIWADSLGPQHRLAGYALNGKGVALLGLHDFEGAKRTLEEALAFREKHEPDPLIIAETRFALARASWEAGDTRRAVALATTARAAYARLPELAPRLRAVEAWLSAHGPLAERR